MTLSRELAPSASEQTVVTNSETTVILGKNLDLIDIARRTEGTVSPREGSTPTIQWKRMGTETPTLQWRDNGSIVHGKFVSDGTQYLHLWRYGSGLPGLENCGVVVGPDFVAFVHGRSNSSKHEVYGTLITHGMLRPFDGPSYTFSQPFLDAKKLTDKQARQASPTSRG